MTALAIGDTVMTKTGRLYILRTFWHSTRHGPSATLSPLKPSPKRHTTGAKVEHLTLVRSRELSLAFHYAADSEREGIPDWMRENARRSAAHWLTRAEQRDADSRAALCLGSDRILDLEAAAA